MPDQAALAGVRLGFGRDPVGDRCEISFCRPPAGLAASVCGVSQHSFMLGARDFAITHCSLHGRVVAAVTHGVAPLGEVIVERAARHLGDIALMAEQRVRIENPANRNAEAAANESTIPIPDFE